MVESRTTYTSYCLVLFSYSYVCISILQSVIIKGRRSDRQILTTFLPVTDGTSAPRTTLLGCDATKPRQRRRRSSESFEQSLRSVCVRLLIYFLASGTTAILTSHQIQLAILKILSILPLEQHARRVSHQLVKCQSRLIYCGQLQLGQVLFSYYIRMLELQVS